MSRILVVDDELRVRDLIKKYAKFEGYEVSEASYGLQALELCRDQNFDIVIMDVMMPELDGFSACKEIRKFSNVPIIILSARGEEYDKIHGFEFGIDDYVVKPFSPREVSLRVKKILSRSAKAQQHAADTPQQTILRYQELSVNLDRMEVLSADKKLDMTAKEVHLLAYLIRNAQKVLNREQILQAVWGYDYYGDTRAVDAVVKRIRKKLPTEGVHYAIQSIYGVGYRLGGVT